MFLNLPYHILETPQYCQYQNKSKQQILTNSYGNIISA